MSLQCWWGYTPGKKLFQLRVVDQHGLQPAYARMAPRSISQFFIAWGLAAGRILSAIGLSPLLPLVNLAVACQVAVEMGFVLLTKKRLAMHDKMFGTQVVLDARQTGK
jgi:uncharacterized RDD family membrane protein YckC